MNIKNLYQYAYVKKPLNEVYAEPSLVPEEFLLEWFKDAYDYQRLHTDEELMRFLGLTPEQILEWLEEVAIFAWEAKRSWLKESNLTDPTA